MKIILVCFWVVVASLAMANPVFAKVSSTGKGEVYYSSKYFGPSAEEERVAIEAAKYNAIEVYVGRVGQEKVQLLKSNRDKIRNNLEDLLLDVRPRPKRVDESSRRLVVQVRVDIDDDLLNVLLSENDSNRVSENISFVFVAREKNQGSGVDNYKVSTVNGVNIVMSGIFSGAGFQVMDAAELQDETGDFLIDINAFKRDYA
ncbi:hypothetical protein LCGC14_2798310, partial [marine sediment metagenome]